MFDGESLSTLYSEYASFEPSQAAPEHVKEFLDELSRVKAITNRQHKTLYKKCEE